MRWMGRRESGNVEDRRGEAAGFGFPRAGGGIGGGGIPLRLLFLLPPKVRLFAFLFLLVVVIASQFGGTPGADSRLAANAANRDETSAAGAAGDDAQKRFVAVVLADTEDVWTALLQAEGKVYTPPKLVLFRSAVDSACGMAMGASGPFYCPGDRKVYIDLSFFEALSRKLGAPGDFAQAYVIAHEVGHHVQHMMGVVEKALRGGQQGQIRLELQADCYGGLWAHHTERMHRSLEPGDIEEAMGAAGAVGDDRIQRKMQGYVVPDSFTHGTAAQRSSWFRRGYESGRLEACDSFAAKNP